MVQFLYQIWFAIIIFGTISNVINIAIFCRMRGKENMSICFLMLSMSDLIYLIIYAFPAVSRFILFHHKRFQWVFDPMIFLVCTLWYGQIFFDYSCFISVYLAAVRCGCVVMPLKFKTTFTRKTTVRVLIAMFLAAVGLRAPQLYANNLDWTGRPGTNTTFVICASSEHNQLILKVNDIVNRNIISWIAYISITVCLVTLISKLRSSSRFRHSASQGLNRTRAGETDEDLSTGQPEFTGTHQQNINTVRPSQELGETDKGSRQEKSSVKMSTKETRLIQSVILISVIFLLSQLPFQVYSTIRLFTPQFTADASQRYRFGLASQISRTCSLLNCSVNIFVYLTYNNKYRARFGALFRWKST